MKGNIGIRERQRAVWTLVKLFILRLWKAKGVVFQKFSLAMRHVPIGKRIPHSCKNTTCSLLFIFLPTTPPFCLSLFFPFHSEQKSCALFPLAGGLPLAEQNKLLLLPKEWRENQNWDERGFSQREPRLMLTGSWRVSLLSQPMPHSLRGGVCESRCQRGQTSGRDQC